MAQIQKRRSQNVTGDLYVDSTCIDCDTCRWMAPNIFHRDGSQSAVFAQPTQEKDRLHALQALLACPTASIGTVDKPIEIQQVQQSLPMLIAENVYHCGYHSEKSFGATSYFIQRDKGNVLVDSPRFTPPLVKQLEAMGGIKYMYLTHRDDVADHAQFQAHFGCTRILHQDDISTETLDVELQIEGTAPYPLASELLIIPVPGHSKGHTVLLHKHFLFTGDHLAWSAGSNRLVGFRRYCWYSWDEQIQSMHKLLNYDFDWILPGHGRRYHASLDDMPQQIKNCIAVMETEA
ncbi:MBL fold metallo-hydrolase [Acaryochloris sp. CCMEE 5410]|uniref:MBL fold metallo-hydrolase n=1 Tax=Acaryochloris sp. CCMEE 5410 TaxID=310037 RepID=UPI0002483E58|nr:MBL fold metallo-hydrolase [Acaryochloris sp. CCMEE 5410]KAI9133527.1 MBL fold metallo-hydrolase [Acaryochloris sp. CCMEE 5410]